MTPIRPEDRPKLIALASAIALVFAYGIYQLVGSRVSSPSASAVAPVTPSTLPLDPPTQVDMGALEPGQVSVTQRPIQDASASRNPFEPIVSRNQPPPPPLKQPSPGSGKPSEKPFVPPGEKPRGSLSGGTGRTGGTGEIVPAVVIAQDKPMELVGVVSGTTSIAMIRTENKDRFVRVGDRVAGYRVAAIGTDVVRLRRGEKTRTLLVGFPAVGNVAVPSGVLSPQSRLVPPGASAPLGNTAPPRAAVALR